MVDVTTVAIPGHGESVLKWPVESMLCVKDPSGWLLLVLCPTNRFPSDVFWFYVLCYLTSFILGCSHVSGRCPDLGLCIALFTLGTMTSLYMNGCRQCLDAYYGLQYIWRATNVIAFMWVAGSYLQIQIVCMPHRWSYFTYEILLTQVMFAVYLKTASLGQISPGEWLVNN
jgi:hypothetical protein